MAGTESMPAATSREWQPSFARPSRSWRFRRSVAVKRTFPKFGPSRLPIVVRVLHESRTYDEAYRNLPDVELWSPAARPIP